MRQQPTDSAVSPTLGRASFALVGGERDLVASGELRTLEPGRLGTLADRARRFFAGVEAGPKLLVGAFPHDRARADRLFQPEVVSKPLVSGGPGLSGLRWSARAEPDAQAYQDAVALALEAIDAGRLTKVVLSRSIVLSADAPIDVSDLFERLVDEPSVVRFSVPVAPGHTLVGATPELLVSKSGLVVRSHPLAGSAPRGLDAAEDQVNAAGLSASDKDRREHATVVEEILDLLSPYCRNLSAPDGTQLTSTRAMWHLGTRIEGELRDVDTSCAELAAVLHPTPAVGGSPRDAAQDLLRELEPYDRGFYAGGVGWIDEAGDGAWYLSLRCGEVAGHDIRLYAGAGVVAGSDPAAEAAETGAKFQTLLRAIGIEDLERILQRTK